VIEQLGRSKQGSASVPVFVRVASTGDGCGPERRAPCLPGRRFLRANATEVLQAANPLPDLIWALRRTLRRRPPPRMESTAARTIRGPEGGTDDVQRRPAVPTETVDRHFTAVASFARQTPARFNRAKKQLQDMETA